MREINAVVVHHGACSVSLALALVTVVELPTLRATYLLGWWSPALCLLVHEKPVLEDPTLELFKYFITVYNTYC